MLEINQYKVKPGAYLHYKGQVYVVENILNHRKVEGVWTKLQDPEVIYRNLQSQYDLVNGVQQLVVKTFARPMSEFTGDVTIEGVTTRRFTPL